jgi:hypothetical protein
MKNPVRLKTSESDHSEPELDLAGMIIAVLKLTDLCSAKNLSIPSIPMVIYYNAIFTTTAMSEAKDDLEDAGDKMKSGAKKTGSKIEDAGEDAKDKVD